MFNLRKIRRLEKEISILKDIIKFADEQNNELTEKIISKNKEIRILKHNELILLKNAEELRNKNKDLENNIEFLFNNLSAQKRKLIRP